MFAISVSRVGIGTLAAGQYSPPVPVHTVAARLRVREPFENFLLVLPFLLFFFLQVFHHQTWRDELNPWAMATQSRSLGALLHLARNEAHPSLWYVLLWVVSRVTVSIIALKWIAALVGASNYLFLAFASPFTRLQKVLLFCSYYISFEYSVFARMYGVMLLLIFLYLRSRTSQPERVARNAAWLGLVANADTFGVLLTFALWIEYLWFLRADRSWWKAHWRKQVVGGVALYIALLAVSFAALIPTRHVSVKDRKGGVLAHVSDPVYLWQAVRGVTMDAWYPLDPEAPYHYWTLINARHVTDAGLVFVTLAALLQFRREKRLLVALAFYGVSLILFLYLVYVGFSRHFGTIFIAFVAMLWIQRSQEQQSGDIEPGGARFGSFSVNFASVPLVVCAWAGIVAAYASWMHPFSQASAAAQWLRANHYDHASLVGTPDYSASYIAEYLERPMYFLECECTDTIMQFSDRRDDFKESQIPVRLARAFAQVRQPICSLWGYGR